MGDVERVFTSGELLALKDGELLALPERADPQSIAARQIDREIRRRRLAQVPADGVQARMITVRLSQAERLLCGRAAASEGLSLNAWCVRHLVDAAIVATENSG